MIDLDAKKFAINMKAAKNLLHKNNRIGNIIGLGILLNNFYFQRYISFDKLS